MKPTHSALAACAAAILALTACGGGGGGTPTAQTPAPQTPAPMETAAPAPEERPAETKAPEAPSAPPAEADSNRVVTIDGATLTMQGVRRAVIALPVFPSGFGGIQSTNTGATGITTDEVLTVFTRGGVAVGITREDESGFLLASSDSATPSGLPRTSSLFGIPGRERTLRTWLIVDDSSENAYSRAWIDVTSVDSDPGNWLAMGTYLHYAGQNLLSTAPDLTSLEAGAFVDGPELRTSPSSLPTLGQARYEGTAQGYYFSRDGTSDLSGARFFASARLTADFSDNTISGCIGCQGDIGLVNWVDATAADSNAAIVLRQTSINEDGAFRADNVLVVNPDWGSVGLTSSQQRGSWGGLLSNVPLRGTRTPSLAAGTFGASYDLSNGVSEAWIGAFIAGHQ